MISFCRKSVNSFLCSLSAAAAAATATCHPEPDDPPPEQPHSLHNDNPSPATGLSLVIRTAKSAAVEKRDPEGVEFDGLMYCTESLGFESSDERTAEGEGLSAPVVEYGGDRAEILSGRKRREKRAAVEFPPPLTSLNHNGQRNFILRPVRKDGRLEITGIRIQRPEILCANRENGRLTLCLVTSDDDDENDDDDDVEIASPEAAVPAKEEEEEREEVGGGEWRIPAVRRCYHHHHTRHKELHVWGQQQCVTSR